MSRSTRHGRWLAALVVLQGAMLCGCGAPEPAAYARRITSPTELIGGPGALGTVGDFLLGNAQIRVVLQDQGWSRGFGMFGGGILDADVARPGALGTFAGGTGQDNFGELFPVLLLQAFDAADRESVDRNTGQVTEEKGIEVLSDGSDGGPAVIRTRASGGDFLYMAKTLVDAAIRPGTGLRYETDYVLEPGARHVKIVGRLINEGPRPIHLPDAGATALFSQLGVDDLQLPLGDVALLGAGNSLFAPGSVERGPHPDFRPNAPADPRLRNPKPIGFDVRFALDAAYLTARSLPALPGLVVDLLATSGPGVSYGLAVADSEHNYVWTNQDQYRRDPRAAVSKHAMLVPFLVDAFTATFHVLAPARLEPGETFEYTRYFLVGDGDVGSIRDELFRLRGVPTGRFEGEVVNAATGVAESEAQVHILDGEGHPYSQVKPDSAGRFRCRLPAGKYQYRVTAPGRWLYPAAGSAQDGERAFAMEAGKGHYAYVRLPPAAQIVAQVRDRSGRPLPAKVTLVSRYAEEHDGLHPREFLFDLHLGERSLQTDLGWRDLPPSQRRREYVEEVVFVHDGYGEGMVRPSGCDEPRCAYDVYVSRGMEYDLFVKRGVFFRPGERVYIDAVLERVVDTTDYVAADLHVHQIDSVDSFLPLDERLIAAAAEALEVPIATDHNALADYRSTIAGINLQDWVKGVTGVELTTMEMGHYNAFPLRYDVGVPSHLPFVGACYEAKSRKVSATMFDWVQCSPKQIFANLRSLTPPSLPYNIVQVNHPRDPLLGYFNQYYVNPYTAEPEEPTEDNYAMVSFIRPQSYTGQFAVDAFSSDFDALEVFNGKRLDALHAFRVPEDAPQSYIDEITDHRCGSGHPSNGPGKPLLRKGGHIAYPGTVDDWMHLLSQGRRVTATGGSDSHKTADEIGVPRTYLRVRPAADGEPRDQYLAQISDLDIVEAVHNHQALVTNGPFLDLAVITDAADGGDEITWPVGSTVRYAESNVDREVTILITLRSAPWIDVERIILYANGVPVETVVVPKGQHADGRDYDDDNRFRLVRRFAADTFLVAEAYGAQSMFPVVTPYEIPPIDAGQAISNIFSGSRDLGSFGGTRDGLHAPDFVRTVVPYALTNPIWLDLDANGHFDPPGISDLGPGPAPNERCEQQPSK